MISRNTGSRAISLALMSGLLLTLAVTLACDRRSDRRAVLAPDRDVVTSPETQFSNIVTLTPEFDTYVERTVFNCAERECDTSRFVFNDDCSYLRLQEWSISECARAHIVLDFRTDLLGLPQNAQVTGVDNATLSMYMLQAYREEVASQPAPLECAPPSIATTNTPTASARVLSWFALDPDTVSVFTYAPVLETPISCPIDGVYQGGQQNYVIPSPGTWGSWNVTPGFSSATATRYVFDYDSNLPGVFQILEFASMENNQSGGQFKPRLSIDVDYTVPFYPCLDGEIARTEATPCTSCTAEAFVPNTSGTIATLKHSEAADPHCEDAHVVLAFNTSGLKEEHTISSVQLKFNVQNELTSGVQQSKVRIYGAQPSGSCPTSLGPGDFAYCGSYTNLGDVTLVPGANTVTIPANAINTSGITKFVLVDASTYNEPDGSVQFLIRMSETSGTASDPRLTVFYD